MHDPERQVFPVLGPLHVRPLLREHPLPRTHGPTHHVAAHEVAVVAAERRGGCEPIGMAEGDGCRADAPHRRAGDGDPIEIDRVVAGCPVEHAHHVVFAQIAVHGVAVAVGRDHEGVEGGQRLVVTGHQRGAVRWVQGPVPIFPVLLFPLRVSAEEPAEHGHRAPVHPVKRDHERPAPLGPRRVPRRNVQAELVELAVSGRGVRAADRPGASVVGIGRVIERRGGVLELAGLRGLRVGIGVAVVDEPRESLAKMPDGVE